MRRWLGILLGVVLVLAGATAVQAEEAVKVKLRRWYVGVQGVAGDRDSWDVYGRESMPPAPVLKEGGGGGLLFGYRFGGRFLLGLQLVMTSHDLEGETEQLHDALALITGTVLFRERSILQPFVRGGFGGAAVILERPGDNSFTVSVGTAVVAGGGLQVRLSSRFSLEWELAADFSNLLEVYDHPEDGPDTDWRVKTSQVGWRTGLGVMFWF